MNTLAVPTTLAAALETRNGGETCRRFRLLFSGVAVAIPARLGETGETQQHPMRRT